MGYVEAFQLLSGCLAAGQTPKMLSDLRASWAPEAFVVSFKLETDNQLLLHKVRAGRPRHPSGVQAAVFTISANYFLGMRRPVSCVCVHLS